MFGYFNNLGENTRQDCLCNVYLLIIRIKFICSNHQTELIFSLVNKLISLFVWDKSHTSYVAKADRKLLILVCSFQMWGFHTWWTVLSFFILIGHFYWLQMDVKE